MIGTVFAILGALLVATSITLVRYRYITGQSLTFAKLQISGSLLFIASTYWHFHIGVILINSFITVVCLHSTWQNRKNKTKPKK